MPFYNEIGVFAEKNAVVIDLGSALTKIGYAGEASPRAIIRTPPLGSDPEILHDSLVNFLQKIYFEHLLVNPSERKVVLVEALIGNTRLRDELVKVLFCHFDIAAILMAPSHLMPLFGLGIKDGLVLDVGYQESTLIPVYENVPILKAWQAQPLASQAIHQALKEDLHRRGTAKICDSSEYKKISELNISIPDHVIEDIKVRLCFVTDIERGHTIQQIRQDASEVSGLSSFLKKSVPAVTYPLDGDTLLRIDGQTREAVCEVLFEQDNDYMSVSTMVLDALLECPIDTRRHLAQNIILIGGTTTIVGFKARLFQELKYLLTLPRYRERLYIKDFKLHSPISKANYTAWAGASLFGTTDTIKTRSFTNESYFKDKSVPDWANLSFNTVYNDDRQG